METLFKIKGDVPLTTTDSVYAFMKELNKYQLLVTESNIETTLEEPADGSTFTLIRPFVDKDIDLQHIREFAWVIGVDTKLNALFIDLLSIGDINRTLVTPWLSFRGTFYYAASAIYLVHNHPSGDPTPSESDVELTKAVIEGGMKMRRPLIDHIILGDNCYHAFEGQMQDLNQMVEQELIEKKALCQMINDEKEKLLVAQITYEHALQDERDKNEKKDKEIAKLKKLLAKK